MRCLRAIASLVIVATVLLAACAPEPEKIVETVEVKVVETVEVPVAETVVVEPTPEDTIVLKLWAWVPEVLNFYSVATTSTPSCILT
jgi:hypothetical protein